MSKSSKSSSTSTTNQNQNVVATPTNPEWVTDSVKGLQGRINGLLDTDASSLVPGASRLQENAFRNADYLGGWRPSSLQAATKAGELMGTTMTPQQAQASLASSRGLLDVDLDAYQNPFEQSVIDTTLAANDEAAGMRRAALAGQQARGQKFSGSGSAIERALFERGALQDRAGIEANLRAQGFDRATGLATGDLNREADTSRFNAGLQTQTSQFNAGQANALRQAEVDAQLRATGLLGDLSNASAVNDRADLGLLADLGAEQRDIERQKLGAEANLLSLVSSLNASQPYELFRGQTTNSTGSSTTNSSSKTTETDPFGAAGGLLGGLGSLASGLGAMGATLGPLAVLSDKRLKTDIETEGKDAAGRRVVSYRYRGEPKHVRRIGHLAQDVAKTDPHAIRKVGKYMAIDYGLLGEVA